VGTTDSDSAATLDVRLPPGWERQTEEEGPDRPIVARKAGATLEIGVDREARDRLGAGGYAHVLAEDLQKRGSDVYVQTDVVYPRSDGLQLYQHVFSQTEGGQEKVYYIGAVEMQHGFGYVLIAEPKDGVTPVLDEDFYEILDKLQLIPATQVDRVRGG
jgi:hypothetical protein